MRRVQIHCNKGQFLATGISIIYVWDMMSPPHFETSRYMDVPNTKETFPVDYPNLYEFFYLLLNTNDHILGDILIE